MPEEPSLSARIFCIFICRLKLSDYGPGILKFQELEAICMTIQLCSALGGRFEAERSYRSFLDGDWITKQEERIKLDFAVDSPFRLEPKVLQNTLPQLQEFFLNLAKRLLDSLR
jgi:hypothetical protein